MDAYKKRGCANVQCTFGKRWMHIQKKDASNVQCTVEKRWMHIKKKSCANVPCTVDKRWMHTKKKLRSKMDVRRQLLRYCTMYGMKNMDEQKVALVYNALNEQDG